MTTDRAEETVPLDPAALARLEGLGLTACQATVYLLIYEGARLRGYQPSMREIMARLGYRSMNAVTCHLQLLARKGWVAEPEASSRAVRLLRRPDGTAFRGFEEG